MRPLVHRWRARSFPTKFSAIVLIAGIAIAAIPLSLSRSAAQQQAQAMAADKAALVGNLVSEQRDSLRSFVSALAAQVGSAHDPATLAATLEGDTQVNGGDDVVGVTGGAGSLLVRGGSVLDDSALAAVLEQAAGSGGSTVADASGVPWILAAAATSQSGVALAARPLDSAALTTLARDVSSSGDAADVALTTQRRWVLGRYAGASVGRGPVEGALATVGVGDSAVIGAGGSEVAVAATAIGGGFSAIVSVPVAQGSAFWAPALLLVAVILVAMLFILVVVQTDVQGPLIRLDRAVAALGRGDFEAPIPPGGDDEIGRLGRSFDSMRRALRATLRSGAARAAIASELNAPQPLERALARVATEVRDSTGADAAMIAVVGTEMGDSFTVCSGIEEADANRLLSGGGPLGIVFHHAEGGAVSLGAISGSEEWAFGLREYCAAPLRIGEHTLGVLGIANRDRAFEAVHRDLVESAAEQVALALERYRFLAVVQRQASIDDLTGLHNHRFLVDYLAQQVALAERLGTPLALLMIDLDHFKELNDTYGHHAGDAALESFAQTLTQSVRRADLAARYGGEEFVVVMADTNREEARLVAEKIRTAVEQTSVIVGERVPAVGITVSIGGAAFPDDTKSAGQLVTLADRAMYAAKAAGRNRVRMADESMIGMPRPSQKDLRGRRRVRRDAVDTGGRPPQ